MTDMKMPTRFSHRFQTALLIGALIWTGGASPQPQAGGFDTPAVFAARDILPPPHWSRGSTFRCSIG